MSEPNQFAPPSPAPRERPSEQCEVIMNGGITSGVVYPWALAEFARRYRLRGLGGASAGAIGAALGAAAEFGRTDGGFDVLVGLPGELRDGKLGELFRAQRTTQPLLGVLLAATGHDKPGQARGTTGRLGGLVACCGGCCRPQPQGTGSSYRLCYRRVQHISQLERQFLPSLPRPSRSHSADQTIEGRGRLESLHEHTGHLRIGRSRPRGGECHGGAVYHPAVS
jgi:hypothetical protein